MKIEDKWWLKEIRFKFVVEIEMSECELSLGIKFIL